MPRNKGAVGLQLLFGNLLKLFVLDFLEDCQLPLIAQIRVAELVAQDPGNGIQASRYLTLHDHEVVIHGLLEHFGLGLALRLHVKHLG